MDLSTLEMGCASDSFSVYLEKARLIWINACTYNPEGHPVHELAKQLGALFEERVIEMQRHPQNDCAWSLESYAAMTAALSQMARFEVFVEPVHPDVAGYAERIVRPMCLSDIQTRIEDERYGSRYDILHDLRRVVQNGIDFNGTSVVGSLARDLGQTIDRLVLARDGDMDGPRYLSSPMRHTLYDNIFRLTARRQRQCFETIKAACPDAVEQHEDGGAIIIEALSFRQFVCVDAAVRGWLAAGSDSKL